MSTTFFPASAAVIAAIIPAPPAPTITISASYVLSSAFADDAPLKSSGLTPAALSAASAALMIPVDETVAPETPSTLIVFPATISPGIFSTATEPMPGVSFGPSAFTSEILPSLSVIVTEIAPGPPNPSAVPEPITEEPRFCCVITIMQIITMAETSANTFFFMIVLPS